MSAHLTRGEARRLGLKLPKPTKRDAGEKAAPQRAPRVPYWSRCCRCQVEFDTIAAEDRHLADTDHRRFEVLG